MHFDVWTSNFIKSIHVSHNFPHPYENITLQQFNFQITILTWHFTDSFIQSVMMLLMMTITGDPFDIISVQSRQNYRYFMNYLFNLSEKSFVFIIIIPLHFIILLNYKTDDILSMREGVFFCVDWILSYLWFESDICFN